MVLHVLLSVRYGGAAGRSRLRRNVAPSHPDTLPHLDQARSALDKCPDPPLVYINPSSSGAPPFFTSSATHDLPLAHPHLPQPYNLRDLRRHGPPHRLPPRVLRRPRKSTAGFRADNFDRLRCVSQWVFAACTLGMAAARLHYTLHLPDNDPLNGGVDFYGT